MANITEEKLTATSEQPNIDEITEDTLITTFDKLVEDGVIVYGPHTSLQTNDPGYPFRICPHLAEKPHTVGAPNPRFNASRPYGPGSDLFCPDERLNIAQLNGTHQLALNLFCVDRPQLLMLTLDSQKRQYEPLNLDDMKVMLEVLRRFPKFYVIFNCGRKGGCSRVHKHMQGLRGPPYAFDLVTSAFTTAPFQRFVHVFEHEQGFIGTPASNIFSVYREFIDECRKMLNLSDQDRCPHNVVMWENCLIVIPRRKGSHNGASANAGGMMGSVWLSSDDELGVWTKIGFANVLQQLGVSSRTDGDV